MPMPEEASFNRLVQFQWKLEQDPCLFEVTVAYSFQHWLVKFGARLVRGAQRKTITGFGVDGEVLWIHLKTMQATGI